MTTPPGLPCHFQQAEEGGSGDWLPEAPIKHYTNAFVLQGDKILLGLKRRGLGIHKSACLCSTNVGGKVEPHEAVREAALRELQEEAGITAPLEPAGTLLFVVPGEKWAHIDIFRAEEYSGTITPSEEMLPEWFNKANIPYEKMWDTDRYWLPLLLAKTPFAVRADFDRQDAETYVVRRWWVGVDLDSQTKE
ncbi:S-adenosyl-L-methionine-dependent methyltransferase [Mycena chlorophos]|uniref:Oxidized purine nucleoside triphosphate hydrolase n=1 Tax=Mycena chlorophos TaxID=658473 RepID=A0A8H6SJB9_MYCCL|nr:S-adenosyl-L-methionine-dependent methyltransferase [Mycena chlorophos]